MYYENPSLIKNIADQSGVRFYLTTNYRPVEFGILTVGANTEWVGGVIPPQASSFSLNYYCQTDCINSLFDNVDEVTVFSSLPHTHSLGKYLNSLLGFYYALNDFLLFSIKNSNFVTKIQLIFAFFF